MYRECIGFHQQYVGNHAKIKPTYEKVNDIWYPANSTEFEPNFTVFDYFPRHELVTAYQLSYFLCEENLNRKKPTDDQFIVVRDSHDFLYKILDYSFLEIDQVRKNFFFDGIYLEEEKGEIPRLFYVFLKSNIIIKLNFRLNVENNKWYADYPIGQSESNNMIESYFLEDGLNNSSIFNFRNNKYLLSDCFNEFKPLGSLDWSADYAFYEKALIYLSRICNDKFLDIQLPTLSEIKHITSLLQANEIYPDTSEGYINTKQYQERILENTNHTGFLLKTYKVLYDKLSKTSDYEKYVAEQVACAVDEHKKAFLEEELAVAREECQKQLDELQKKIEEKENEFNGLDDLVGKLKNDQIQLDSSINNLKVLINQFMQEAVDLSFNERQIIEKLDQKINNQNLLQGRSLLPSVLPPWSYVESKVEAEVISETEVLDIFRNLASTYGYESRNVIVFDRLMRTGNLVLLINQYAHQFIEQYSRLICGGRISHIALDASCIGIDDLWRNPATHLNTGFAYAWNNALNNPDHYYVIHLTGITEISYLSFFEQFKQVMTSALRPKNLLIVSSISIDISTLESKSQQMLKNITKFLVPLKFNNLNIDVTSALKSLDIKNLSEVMYLDDPNRFIQIMKTSIKTHAQFLQYERLYSLPALPEHLFTQKDSVLVCDEILDAIQMIEEL